MLAVDSQSQIRKNNTTLPIMNAHAYFERHQIKICRATDTMQKVSLHANGGAYFQSRSSSYAWRTILAAIKRHFHCPLSPPRSRSSRRPGKEDFRKVGLLLPAVVRSHPPCRLLGPTNVFAWDRQHGRSRERLEICIWCEPTASHCSTT